MDKMTLDMVRKNKNNVWSNSLDERMYEHEEENDYSTESYYNKEAFEDEWEDYMKEWEN